MTKKNRDLSRDILMDDTIFFPNYFCVKYLFGNFVKEKEKYFGS